MADVDNKIKMIVEGLLLAAGKPISLSEITSVFSEDERPDKEELKEVLAAIAEDCNDRGFELKEVASGFRFQVKQDISEWIARLWEEKPPRYSRALLETLALVAYRQPITRGDIEEIRGVAVSSNIMRTLVDREWVRVVGHKDVPGKPALYATTRQFLDYFNLKSIQELPPLSEIRELAKGGDQFDVEDDLANRNILELPDEEAEDQPTVLGEEGEALVFEPGELPDEDEAAALSVKPLDEILGLVSEDGDEDDELTPDEPVFSAEETEETDRAEATEPAEEIEEIEAIEGIEVIELIEGIEGTEEAEKTEKTEEAEQSEAAEGADTELSYDIDTGEQSVSEESEAFPDEQLEEQPDDQSKQAHVAHLSPDAENDPEQPRTEPASESSAR